MEQVRQVERHGRVWKIVRLTRAEAERRDREPRSSTPGTPPGHDGRARVEWEPMPSPDPRRITARLVRQGPEEREFDDRFWRDLGPVKRLETVWDMVLEAYAWKGEDPGQPRLQRSLLRVERR